MSDVLALVAGLQHPCKYSGCVVIEILRDTIVDNLLARLACHSTYYIQHVRAHIAENRFASRNQICYINSYPATE